MASGQKASPRYKNPKFLKALGRHCQKLRVAKGYSIDRMYREGDQLSPAAIQRLENGTGDVHISLLYRYAEVLEIPMKKLLEFKEAEF